MVCPAAGALGSTRGATLADPATYETPTGSTSRKLRLYPVGPDGLLALSVTVESSPKSTLPGASLFIEMFGVPAAWAAGAAPSRVSSRERRRSRRRMALEGLAAAVLTPLSVPP